MIDQPNDDLIATMAQLLNDNSTLVDDLSAKSIQIQQQVLRFNVRYTLSSEKSWRNCSIMLDICLRGVKGTM